MKHFEKLANFILTIGFVVGVLAIFRLKYDRFSQFLVLCLLVLFYLIWGFAYHHAKKELTVRLFGEYLLIGLIGLAVGVLVFF